MWGQWVLDATMGCQEGLFCFCPIEGDINGDYSIVVGMNIVSDEPPGKLVAIVHEGGQEAVEAFCEEYAEELLSSSEEREAMALEKSRTRWRRWLGNKTRADKPYWVTLLDSNFVSWVGKVFDDCGFEYHGISWKTRRGQLKAQYLKAINNATMQHLYALDELYVIDKFSY